MHIPGLAAGVSLRVVFRRRRGDAVVGTRSGKPAVAMDGTAGAKAATATPTVLAADWLVDGHRPRRQRDRSVIWELRAFPTIW